MTSLDTSATKLTLTSKGNWRMPRKRKRGSEGAVTAKKHQIKLSKLKKCLLVFFQAAIEESPHDEHVFIQGHDLKVRSWLTKSEEPSRKKILKVLPKDFSLDEPNRRLQTDERGSGLLTWLLGTLPFKVKVVGRVAREVKRFVTQGIMGVDNLKNVIYIQVETTKTKEDRFDEVKNSQGSCFAWHGSPLYNWHSILRTGLQGMSGTKYAVHGASLGNGIYVSPDMKKAMYYAPVFEGYRAVALLEVLKGDQANRITNSEDNIYLVPNPSLLRIRYVLLFEHEC